MARAPKKLTKKAGQSAARRRVEQRAMAKQEKSKNVFGNKKPTGRY